MNFYPCTLIFDPVGDPQDTILKILYFLGKLVGQLVFAIRFSKSKKKISLHPILHTKLSRNEQKTYLGPRSGP